MPNDQASQPKEAVQHAPEVHAEDGRGNSENSGKASGGEGQVLGSGIPDTSGLDPQARIAKALEYIAETETAEAKASVEEDGEVVEQEASAKEEAKQEVAKEDPAKPKEPSATEKFLSRLEAAKQRREQGEKTRSVSSETDTLKKEVETLRSQLNGLLTNPSETLLKLGKDPVAYVDRIANFKPESPEEKAIRERREYDESLQREINNLKEQINGITQQGQSAQERAIQHEVLRKAEAVGEDGTPLFPYAYSEYSADQVYSRAVEIAKEVGAINKQRKESGEPPLSYSDEEILAVVDLEAKKLYIDRENRRKKAKLTAREEEDALEERVGRSDKKARTSITSAVAGQRSTGKALTPDERRKEAERYLASQGFR